MLFCDPAPYKFDGQLRGPVDLIRQFFQFLVTGQAFAIDRYQKITAFQFQGGQDQCVRLLSNDKTIDRSAGPENAQIQTFQQPGHQILVKISPGPPRDLYRW